MSDAKPDLPVLRESPRSVANKQPTAVAEYAPYAAYPASEREGSSFGSIGEKLLRRWGLISAVFAGVAATGVGLTLMQTPRYSATALLIINPTPDQIVPEKQSSNGRSDAATVDSEIEVLKSPWLAARLADELDLSNDPEWGDDEAASQTTSGVQLVQLSPPSQIAARYDGNIASDASTAAVTGADLSASSSPQVSDGLVAAVGEAIDIRRRGLSYVVEVTAQSQSPQRAAEMANGLSNIYLRSLTEARYDASEKANVWLEDRLGELKLEVERKQAAAQAYRARANLLTTQGVSLVEQQLAQVQSSLLQTRAQYAQKDAEYRLLSDVARSGKTVSTMNTQNDAMRDLRAKEADIAQKIADLQSRYGPAHPSLIQALEEKASLDSRISEEMARTTSKAKLEAEALAARLNIEETELASLRGGLVTENFDQVRLDALQTDAEAAQSVYESFLQRYHEVARQGTATGVGARLLSPARPPTAASSPQFLLNFALVGAAALVLALLAGLIAEQFRRAVETTEEVEKRVGARALVAIPALRGKDLRNMPKRNRSPTSYLLTKRMSPFAEAFRVLQTAIQLADRPNRKVVAVTSAMPGEGKTTLSLGLARVAAMGGQKSIIVDCDIRMRSINGILGIDPQEGIQEVLSGERSWRDVVGKDEPSGAHILPASGITSKDIFGTGAMEDLIRELAAEYDLVILDCPPVFAVADARVIGSLSDSVVVAARAGKTHARAVQAAIEQLELAGANVLGVALNRVDMRRSKRSFYDGLYYSKAFSGYYARET
ncbi:MAG: polysaccharide biosynthesis tyrosine autokinase [Hyphomonadaceae bacterium]|nr:polysaccharide biosynthesis tyrosine autokinase [Hyphomonadaceae bacterium]